MCADVCFLEDKFLCLLDCISSFPAVVVQHCQGCAGPCVGPCADWGSYPGLCCHRNVGQIRLCSFSTLYPLEDGGTLPVFFLGSVCSSWVYMSMSQDIDPPPSWKQFDFQWGWGSTVPSKSGWAAGDQGDFKNEPLKLTGAEYKKMPMF